MKRLLQIFSVYNQLLIRFPVATKSVTSGVLFVGGDLMAQTLQNRINKPDKDLLKPGSTIANEEFIIDWERTAVFFIFGTLVCGPAFHFWFNFLAVMPRRLLIRINTPYSIWKERTIQILSDQVIFAPNYTLIFFSSVGMMEGTLKQYRLQNSQRNGAVQISWREIWKTTWNHVKQVYLTTYLTDCLFWPPFQLINFSYVPLRYQFLFANVANLTWNTFLSFMANNVDNNNKSERR